jgi:hypothetical protein
MPLQVNPGQSCGDVVIRVCAQSEVDGTELREAPTLSVDTGRRQSDALCTHPFCRVVGFRPGQATDRQPFIAAMVASRRAVVLVGAVTALSVPTVAAAQAPVVSGLEGEQFSALTRVGPGDEPGNVQITSSRCDADSASITLRHRDQPRGRAPARSLRQARSRAARLTPRSPFFGSRRVDVRRGHVYDRLPSRHSRWHQDHAVWR